MLVILKLVISKYDTRETKVKTVLLGSKNGCKIPIIGKPTGGI